MTPVAKSQIWDWLKAERKWKDAVRQWLNREQYPDLEWPDRVMGRPNAPITPNRAFRRRHGLKRINV